MKPLNEYTAADWCRLRPLSHFLKTARDADWHLKFERGLNDHEDLTIQPIAQAIHQSREKNKRHETA